MTENTITLMDGTILESWTKKPGEISFTPAEKQRQHDLFVANAFYLIAHRDRILKDSRMFLAPVPIFSGLAYSGSFSRPVLGAYLEWWKTCPGAMRKDSKGRISLVYKLAGSPLSGCNSSSEVFEDGRKGTVQLIPFINYWRPFVTILNRYREAKVNFQAYSLQEVLDILHKEDDGNFDYARIINEQYLQAEILRLTEEVNSLTRNSEHWEKMYHELFFKYNDAKIRLYYADYQALLSEANRETAKLREQIRVLKSDLKSGKLDNISYQKAVTPLTRRIKDYEYGLSSFRWNTLKQRFPDEQISFELVENYIRQNRTDGKISPSLQ